MLLTLDRLLPKSLFSWSKRFFGGRIALCLANLFVGDQHSKSEAKIIGHGHVAGSDAKINPDLSTLTNSLKLIKKVEAAYRP